MRIAVVQITSKLDYQENLEKIRGFLFEAKKEKAKVAFLPECFLSLSNGLEPSPHLVDLDQLDSCPLFKEIKKLATDSGIALIGGSVATKSGNKILNTSFQVSSEGELLGSYHKNHLFSCQLGSKAINEADIYEPGRGEKCLIPLDEFHIGINICFDIRFPEQSFAYVKEGANLLTFSSAFTIPTGKAHWHLLNRARAVESQSFVVSAAQWGNNNERISTYGHSLVVDPWGEILLDLSEGEKVDFVDLDYSLIDATRKKVDMKSARYL